MLKLCRCCGLEGDHRTKTNQPDKAVGRCRSCEVKIQIKKTNYKRSVLSRYKSIKGCTTCGIKDFRVLDFDHINPMYKSYNIATNIPNKGLRTLAEEVSKCQVLCSNCHRIKTYESQDRRTRR